MKVRVKLFAVAKELAGRDELAVDVPARRDGRRRATAPSQQRIPRSHESCRTPCGPSTPSTPTTTHRSTNNPKSP